MSNKIRPPQREHSPGASPPELREEGEGFLAELVRAPDPGPVPEGAISANANDPGNVSNAGPILTPAQLAAFAPQEAAELRAQHNDQNRLGKPARATPAEKLVTEYIEAEAEMKRRYAGTRDLSGQERFLKAKEAMIAAGLMKGDV